MFLVESIMSEYPDTCSTTLRASAGKHMRETFHRPRGRMRHPRDLSIAVARDKGSNIHRHQLCMSACILEEGSRASDPHSPPIQRMQESVCPARMDCLAYARRVAGAGQAARDCTEQSLSCQHAAGGSVASCRACASSKATPLQALAWLRRMTLFCEELYAFVQKEVPEHADASSYTRVPKEAVQKREIYAHMLSACGWQGSDGSLKRSSSSSTQSCTPCRYMMDIPCNSHPECKSAVELVQGLGAETYALINRHPAFGKFRCSEGKGFNAHPGQEGKLFFEDPLNMCMALGTEHTWLDLAACRAKARVHLEGGGFASKIPSELI